MRAAFSLMNVGRPSPVPAAFPSKALNRKVRKGRREMTHRAAAHFLSDLSEASVLFAVTSFSGREQQGGELRASQ